jgi:hypothetical protein
LYSFTISSQGAEQRYRASTFHFPFVIGSRYLNITNGKWKWKLDLLVHYFSPLGKTALTGSDFFLLLTETKKCIDFCGNVLISAFFSAIPIMIKTVTDMH